MRTRNLTKCINAHLQHYMLQFFCHESKYRTLDHSAEVLNTLDFTSTPTYVYKPVSLSTGIAQTWPLRNNLNHLKCSLSYLFYLVGYILSVQLSDDRWSVHIC
jgi:hypothetical protein